MRPILMLLSASILGLTVWHALAVVAPRIEVGIEDRARAAVGDGHAHPLAIAVRGRMVRVSGLADSEAERDAILARIAALPGVGEIEDRIEVLPHRAPFRFAALRLPDAPLSIEGHVPNAAAERDVLDLARGVATGHVLHSALEIAAGMPDPRWIASVGGGLGALGQMAEGRLEITGTNGRLSGRAANEAVRERVLAMIEGDPVVAWQTDIDVILPLARPYRFEALRSAEGDVRYGGNAPNETIRQRLSEALRPLGENAAGEITLAEGMPSEDWPRLVRRGLEALAALESGRFTITGLDARLTGVAATPEAAAEAARHAGELILLDIAIATPHPAARLEIEVRDDEARLTGGRLPEGLSRRKILETLPVLASDEAEIATGGRGDTASWDSALAALAIVLPRVATGRALIEDDRLVIEGRLKPGFSAATTRTALRSATGGEWSLDLKLDEAPPSSELSISADGGRIVLSGILPAGLADETALVRLGGAEAGGLTSGGAGDPLAWRQALDAVTALLPAYARLEARVAEGSVTVDGTLAPGQTAARLADWLAGRLAAGWSADLNGAEQLAIEGATRLDIASGGQQRLTAGYWLPVIEVAPTREGCARAIAEHVPPGRIAFLAGKTELEPGARSAVDMLAAIALTCTREAGLLLEIGGHTDSQGDPRENLDLSTRRAQAVLDALAARGIPMTRLAAAGHGSAMPIADNATPEGRSRNRRITLDWRPAPADPAPDVPETAMPTGHLPPDGTGAETAAAGADAADTLDELTSTAATGSELAIAPVAAPTPRFRPARAPTAGAEPTSTGDRRQ